MLVDPKTGLIYIPNDGTACIIPGQSHGGVDPPPPATLPPLPLWRINFNSQGSASNTNPRGFNVLLDSWTQPALSTLHGLDQNWPYGAVIVTADETACLDYIKSIGYSFNDGGYLANITCTGPGLWIATVCDASWDVSPSTINSTFTLPNNPPVPIGVTTDWAPTPDNSAGGLLPGAFVVTKVAPADVFDMVTAGDATKLVGGGSVTLNGQHAAVGQGTVGQVPPPQQVGQALIRTPGTYSLYAISTAPQNSGFLLPKIVPFTLTVSAQPPQTPPPPPVGAVRPAPAVQIVEGALALPTGGSPRICLLISRGVGVFPSGSWSADSTVTWWGRLTAPRCCVSLDGGITFKAGVDVGVKLVDDTVVGDDFEVGSIINCFMGLRVLAGSRLWANGVMPGAATLSTVHPDLLTGRPWKHARISDDLGATWRDATTTNLAGPPYAANATVYLPQSGGACWRTRGGFEGKKGAHGHAGGPARLMTLAQKFGSDGTTLLGWYWAESLDNGDTWQIATDLGTNGLIGQTPSWAPIFWQPQSYFGVSIERLWSYDDFMSVGGFGYFGVSTDPTQFISIGGTLVQTVSSDGLYDVAGGFWNRASGFKLFANDTHHAVLTKSAKRIQWSRTKDGLNLAPVPFGADAMGILKGSNTDAAFHWLGRGRIVNPVDVGNVCQAYATDNDGDYWYKTCHTNDGGQRWVSD